MSLVPLYGFLQGDTIGLLILAHDRTTIGEVIQKLVKSAEVRQSRQSHYRLFSSSRELSPALTVAEAGLTALDQVEVRHHD